MAALNTMTVAQATRTAADIVCKRMGWGDASKSAQVIMAIPEALKATARKVAADPSTRALLQTDPKNVSGAIGSGGIVDLTALYASSNLLKEFIEFGQMYLLTSATFATTAVDVTANSITLASPHRLDVGDTVRFSSTSALPGGLSGGSTDHFVRTWNSTTNAFTVAATNALDADIDITTQGVGTHTVTVRVAAGFPLQKMGSPSVAFYPRYLDAVFRHYYIQGDDLVLKPAALTGSVGFAVPYIPTAANALGPSPEVELIFLDTLAQIVAQDRARAIGEMAA